MAHKKGCECETTKILESKMSQTPSSSVLQNFFFFSKLGWFLLALKKNLCERNFEILQND